MEQIERVIQHNGMRLKVSFKKFTTIEPGCPEGFLPTEHCPIFVVSTKRKNCEEFMIQQQAFTCGEFNFKSFFHMAPPSQRHRPIDWAGSESGLFVKMLFRFWIHDVSADVESPMTPAMLIPNWEESLRRLDERMARGIHPCAVKTPNNADSAWIGSGHRGEPWIAGSAEDAYYISTGRADLAVGSRMA